MKRHLSIVLIVALGLLLTTGEKSWAGDIVGVVKPQGLRTAENILVYVVKAPPLSVDASQANYLMDQKQLTFIPHILPVLVGAKIDFPNNDEVAHNVFSLSRTK
jgi:plastocyanin